MIYTNFCVVFFDFQEEWQWGGVNWYKNTWSLTTLLLNFSYTHCSPLTAHCSSLTVFVCKFTKSKLCISTKCKVLQTSLVYDADNEWDKLFAFSRRDRLRHVARWASPRLPIGFATLRDGHREHQTLPSPHSQSLRSRRIDKSTVIGNR